MDQLTVRFDILDAAGKPVLYPATGEPHSFVYKVDPSVIQMVETWMARFDVEDKEGVVTRKFTNAGAVAADKLFATFKEIASQVTAEQRAVAMKAMAEAEDAQFLKMFVSVKEA